jgi:hypothetical protein
MGECCHCGECCRWIVFGDARQLDPWALGYFVARGAKINKGLVLIPSECPHLKLNEFNPSESLCDIEDNKPGACKEYVGKRISGGRKYWVPDNCTMTKK